MPRLATPHIIGHNSHMRNLTAILCLTLAVLLGSAGVSESADFRDCERTYKNKNYDTAIRLCRPFAKQGNASAQHKMGVMYDTGQGVPQDYKTKVKSYRLTAEQGMPMPKEIWV